MQHILLNLKKGPQNNVKHQRLKIRMRKPINLCKAIEIKHRLFRLTVPHKQEPHVKITHNHNLTLHLPDTPMAPTFIQPRVITDNRHNNKMEQLPIKV